MILSISGFSCRHRKTCAVLCAMCIKSMLGTLPAVRAAITIDPNSVGATSTIPAYDGSDPWQQPSNHLYVGSLANGEVLVDGGSDVNFASTSVGVTLQGGFASLTIQGSGTTWIDASPVGPTLGVGGYGDVALNVLGGGTLETDGAWLDSGVYNGHIGHTSLTVSGDGSNWNARTNDIWLEADPNGADVSMYVLDGGKVRGRSLVIGYAYEGGPALTEVRGAGSKISMSSIVAVSISRNQGLRISEGGVVESVLGFVGQFGTDVALAIVDGAGSRWSMSNDLFVGRDGRGEVRVLNGATLTSRRGILGLSTGIYPTPPPSAGVVTVAGANSSWTVLQTLTVGNNDRGSLTVQEGGKVFANTLDLAATSADNATGSVAIDGVGSLIQVAGTLRVGVNNSGDVTIRNGATLSSATGLIDSGSVEISGMGSTWSGGSKSIGVHGSLQISQQGQVVTTAGYVVNSGIVSGDGTLVGGFLNDGAVRPGMPFGSLKINGSYRQLSAGKLAIDVGSAGYGFLDITGMAFISGTLEVSTPVDGPSVFRAGDWFDVVNAAEGVSGIFTTVVLPNLQNNLFWQVNYGSTAISLLIVSEPGTSSVAIIAGVLFAAWRRGRRQFLF
jgi:T5SS/PEP-CTERM-associated repeat protein